MTTCSLLWILAFISLLFGFRGLLKNGFAHVWRKSEIETSVSIRHRIQDFQEKILCGIFPEDEDWKAIESLPAPWGPTTSAILYSLREKGASLTPSLRRLKELLLSQEEALKDGKAKAAAAVGQSVLILFILPALSALLYLLVPGLSDRSILWISVSGFAVILASVGVAWVMKCAECARFGGLKTSERVWVLDASLFLEKLASFIQAGHAPDVVWAEAHAALPTELATRWGAILWKAEDESSHALMESKTLRESILTLGNQARRTLQMSLYEGRPALEALETLIRAFQHEIHAFQERELQKLPIQTLKPLFITVAPGAFLLLGVSISIMVSEAFETGPAF